MIIRTSSKSGSEAGNNNLPYLDVEYDVGSIQPLKAGDLGYNMQRQGSPDWWVWAFDKEFEVSSIRSLTIRAGGNGMWRIDNKLVLVEMKDGDVVVVSYDTAVVELE